MNSNIAPPRTSSLSRIGLPLTILSALILVGTLGYWVYANSGGVTVNDAGLKSTLTALVIASAVAGVLDAQALDGGAGAGRQALGDLDIALDGRVEVLGGGAVGAACRSHLSIPSPWPVARALRAPS